jgi:hypothetical protein
MIKQFSQVEYNLNCGFAMQIEKRYVVTGMLIIETLWFETGRKIYLNILKSTKNRPSIYS